MELGPYSVVLTPPVLTATQDGGGGAIVAQPEHVIRVAFSGVVAGGYWELWCARTDTAIEPTVNDPAWRYLYAGTQAAIDVTMLQSGSRYWFRARVGYPKQVSSDWSTAVTAITKAYSAPTSLVASETLSTSTLVAWTQQYDYLDLELLVDGEVVGRRIAGAERARLTGLTPGTTHAIGVRYVDPYGGRTAAGTVNVTTSSGPDTLNPPQYLAITIGDNVGTRSTT
jgi:hypothetical protein